MSSTKESIIEHALSLLMQKGYSGWSYDHIAKKVGIRKASIHYYFPSKEDLVEEALKQYIERFFASLENKTNKLPEAKEKLKVLFSFFKATCESADEICLCTMMASDFFTLSPGIKNALADFYERLRDWIKAEIAADMWERKLKSPVDPQKKADLIVNVLQGLMVTSKIITNEEPFNHCMQLLTK